MNEVQQPMPHQHQQQGVPPQYDYRVLTDILEGPIPTECNLYAVIVECSVPRPTRGKGVHLPLIRSSAFMLDYSRASGLFQGTYPPLASLRRLVVQCETGGPQHTGAPASAGRRGGFNVWCSTGSPAEPELSGGHHPYTSACSAHSHLIWILHFIKGEEGSNSALGVPVRALRVCWEQKSLLVLAFLLYRCRNISVNHSSWLQPVPEGGASTASSMARTLR